MAKSASGKGNYIAKVGIDFDEADPPRVEPGDPIPAGLDHDSIQELLDIDAIEEREN